MAKKVKRKVYRSSGWIVLYSEETHESYFTNFATRRWARQAASYNRKHGIDCRVIRVRITEVKP